MQYSDIDFDGKTMAILMVFRVAWCHSMGCGGYSKGLKSPAFGHYSRFQCSV